MLCWVIVRERNIYIYTISALVGKKAKNGVEQENSQQHGYSWVAANVQVVHRE